MSAYPNESDIVNSFVERAKLHWEAVADALPQLICLIDASGKVLRCNRTIERWGIGKVNQVAGKGVHALLHPRCQDPLCELRMHLENACHNPVAALPLRLEKFDPQMNRSLRIHMATVLPFEATVGPERPPVLIVIEDVTTQVDMERKFAASRNELQLLVDSASDLIIRHGRDGEVHYVSPAIVDMLGYGPEVVLGKNLFELVCHDDGRIVEKGIAGALLGGGPGDLDSYEFRIEDASGVCRWVEAKSHALTDNPDGSEVVSILRDITDRHLEDELAIEYSRKLEAEVRSKTDQLMTVIEMLKRQIRDSECSRMNLEALSQRYTTLVENTLTGIYLRRKNKVVFCNERFARIFGYSSSEITGMDLEHLLVSGEGNCVMFDRTNEVDLEMVKEDVVEGRTRDGTKIWLNLSRAQFRDREGEFVLGNVIDVSEQVRMHNELRRSERRLHKLSSLLIGAQENERKRIANELHDGVGQRLSAIKFSVEEVLQNEACVQAPGQAERLRDVVVKIRDTIEEVRRASMDLRPSILDDLGLVATITWFCREFATMFPWMTLSKHIEADEREIPEYLKVVVFRVMQESFHNIAKHAGAMKLEISLRLEDDLLTLEVADDGCGFAMEEVEKLAGLGLRSMRERAELLGGHFQINSQRDVGTYVKASWPLLSDEDTLELDQPVLNGVGGNL